MKPEGENQEQAVMLSLDLTKIVYCCKKFKIKTLFHFFNFVIQFGSGLGTLGLLHIEPSRAILLGNLFTNLDCSRQCQEEFLVQNNSESTLHKNYQQLNEAEIIST